MDRDAYAPLESRIGYAFLDLVLLESALTHKSFLNENPGAGRPDNERLEFLGDAVVGLAISHLLMEAHPGRSEGELTRTRAQLVNESGLAEIAAEIGLGEWLFLGRGEEQSGGRQKPSLLADACEALIAAVYQDGSFDAALVVVRRLFGARVGAAFSNGGADYKTRLQERAQGRLRTQPRYVVVGATGPDHGKVFEVAVQIGEREVARGQGRSKKEAEQRAAERALLALDAEERATAAPGAPAPGVTDVE